MKPTLAAEQEKMRRRHGAAIARACSPTYEPGGHVAEEQHFVPREVAKMWGISVWTVRKMFANVLAFSRSALKENTFPFIFPPESCMLIMLGCAKNLGGQSTGSRHIVARDRAMICLRVATSDQTRGSGDYERNRLP